MAKIKKLHTFRPKIELHVRKPFGWFLIPFFVLRVYAKLFRFIRGNMICGKWKVTKIYALIIPKIKLVDGE